VDKQLPRSKYKFKPKIHASKDKKLKIFSNFEDYKSKVYRSSKKLKGSNFVKKYESEKKSIFPIYETPATNNLSIMRKEASERSQDIDPLNLTFNKDGNNSVIKDVPYLNHRASDNTTACSAKNESRKRSESDVLTLNNSTSDNIMDMLNKLNQNKIRSNYESNHSPNKTTNENVKQLH